MLTKQEDVIDFIARRFDEINCEWTTGNCYYFALILSDRFKSDNPIICYDAVEGHFICKIEDKYYDWTGVLKYSDDYINKHIYNWNSLKDEDPIWYERIVRDVLM